MKLEPIPQVAFIWTVELYPHPAKVTIILMVDHLPPRKKESFVKWTFTLIPQVVMIWIVEFQPHSSKVTIIWMVNHHPIPQIAIISTVDLRAHTPRSNHFLMKSFTRIWCFFFVTFGLCSHIWIIWKVELLFWTERHFYFAKNSRRRRLRVVVFLCIC